MLFALVLFASVPAEDAERPQKHSTQSVERATTAHVIRNTDHVSFFKELSMSSAIHSQEIRKLGEASASRAAIGGLRFDWMMVVISTIFLGGLYLDGWAHNHGRVDQSFFTPWHAFFYGGFLLSGLAMVGTIAINRSRGYTLYQSIPDGYKSTLTGLMIFGAGGAGDLVWHLLFGIENGIEALFSPTHLMLGVGLTLVVSGPLRAAWQRRDKVQEWRTLGPAMLSLCLFISTLTFFQFFSHPVAAMLSANSRRHFHTDVGAMAGILAFLLMSALLVGPVLLAMRRWRLPLGSLTLIWGLNTIAMTIIDYKNTTMIGLGAAMIGAAILLDLIQWRLNPSASTPDRLRIFAFLAPVLLSGAYFAVLLATVGTAWTVHLWTGTIFLTGIVGLLLSYLLIPPAIPGESV
jgi:hypothetical protein